MSDELTVPDAIDALVAQIPELAPLPEDGGRRSYLTRQTATRIITALRDGQSLKTSAGLAAISYEALYAWIRRGDETDASPHYVIFRQAVDAAKAEAVAKSIRGVLAAGEKDWKAYAWHAARAEPESWAERSREGESGASGVTINVGIALNSAGNELQAIDTQWVSVPQLPKPVG